MGHKISHTKKLEPHKAACLLTGFKKQTEKNPMRRLTVT